MKAEYEAALAAYEEALGELKSAKVLAAMPKAYPSSGGGGLLGALVTIAEPINLAEKEKAVEIAWQRLEVAKVRMMSRYTLPKNIYNCRVIFIISKTKQTTKCFKPPYKQVKKE